MRAPRCLAGSYSSTMSKPALKVLLNLVLIAGDALVRGGRLDVGAEKHSGGIDIVVRADGAESNRATLTLTQGGPPARAARVEVSPSKRRRV